ncbi:MAG: hypothetical protein JNG83_02930 [Opitutaceae bacterium]|nr:hypothetical protein [Opitutaceae bacterium]
MILRPLLICALLPVALSAAAPAIAPAEAVEPVRYTGGVQADKTRYDGRVPHAVGVHNIQAMRANRTHPPGQGITGFTYNHQPYLAYWKGRFYLQYLSALFQEHEPPTNTSVMTSADGYSWSPPRVVFPEYILPEIKRDGVNIPAGMIAIMHQRMGFYVAPDGRLLTLGFYGFAETPQHSPNAGNGVGRVVREIHADGSLGPVYFIRYNRHAGFDESNTSFPFYTTSPDQGFVAACNALLADKLFTLQWWEEDRGKDGFFAMEPDRVAGAAHFDAKIVTSAGAGKAFAWYTRPDGVVVGLWKNQYAALSADRGLTWATIGQIPTFAGDAGAKTWGQRTDDGRFAIVQARSATNANRFPMVAFVGEDGRSFDTMLCLQGEVSPRRFRGQYKGAGVHYFRGIEEGNGNPPGNDLWMTYSMNKEDIWVQRTPLPLAGQATAKLDDGFEEPAALARWNLHLPLWAPIRVAEEPGASNRVLELRDEDPYEYALAERHFPSARQLKLRFRVQPRVNAQATAFEIEVQSQAGERPLRLRFNQSWFSHDHGRRASPQVRITPLRWYDVELDLDCEKQSYRLRFDGQVVGEGIPFAEKTASLERIVFRTGPYRGQVPAPILGDIERPTGVETEDLPGADERAASTVYWIDDLRGEGK